ncbi:MAG: PAS domain-containing protein [Saprospiraceae bacterium]
MQGTMLNQAARDATMHDFLWSFDWSNHPLQAPVVWSSALLNSVNLLLANPNPAFLWWGEAFYTFYNDAAKALLEAQQHNCFGQAAEQFMPDIAQELTLRRQSIEKEGVFFELLLERMLVQETAVSEPHWNFCCTPLWETDDEIAGFMAIGTATLHAALVPLDKLPSVVYVRDLQEVKNFFVSSQVRKELGYTEAEIIAMGGHFVRTVMHPEDLVRMQAQEELFQELGDGETLQFEYRMQHRNGEWRWFLSRDAVFKRTPDGQPLQIIGTATNITEYKRTEGAMRLLNERFEIAEQAIKGFWYDWSPVTNQVMRSSTFTQVMGYEHDEIEQSGKAWMQLYHPDDMERIAAEIEKGITNKVRDYSLEYRVRHKDGHWVYLLDNAHVFYNQRNNEIERVVGLSMDITERKQQEEQVQIKFEELDNLYRTAPIGLALIDKAFRFIRVNEHLAEINGPPVREHIGKTLYEIVPGIASEVEKIFRQVIETGNAVLNVEISGETKANPGAIRYWNESWYPLKNARREVFAISVIVEEITTRKHAEEALRESEARFREMADHAPMMVWMTEIDGNCTYLSQSWYDFTGQTPEIGLGFGWLNAVHPDDRQLSEHTFTTANRRRESFRLEYRLRRKDGAYRWAIDTAQPRFSSQGAFLGYIGSVIDITERKRQELNTQFLDEISRDLALLTSSKKIMEVLSEKIAAHLGVSRVFFVEVDEINNRSIVLYDWCIADLPSTVGVYPLEDYASPAFLQELTQGKPVIINDVRTHPVTAAAAERFAALGMGSSVNAPYKSNGQLKFLLAIQHVHAYDWHEDEIELLIELSARIWGQIERTRAEAALRESERRLRLAQQAAGIGIHDWDITSGVIDWDVRVRELWGVAPDEPITFDLFAQSIHPDDWETTQAAIDRALDPAGNGLYYATYRVFNRTDGTTRWIIATGQVSFEHGRATRLIGTVQDVTEQKRLEELKDTFVRIAGHELRSPLTSLLGYLEMAKRAMDVAHPVSNFVQKAYNSTLKMRRLVQDFLDIYRIQNGEITYETAEFDFDTLVRNAIENTQSAYPKYTIHLQGQTGAILKGDQNRLEQVIINLLNNAIKYSPGKEQVEVSLARSADYVQLCVKDNGIGIREEDIPKIFDRYYRVSNASKIKGMGLGLYLVKQIVDFHQGKIAVDSKPDQGSTFIVELPCV